VLEVGDPAAIPVERGASATFIADQHAARRRRHSRYRPSEQLQSELPCGRRSKIYAQWQGVFRRPDKAAVRKSLGRSLNPSLQPN
jgi:hypothetical protein